VGEQKRIRLANVDIIIQYKNIATQYKVGITPTPILV